MSTPQLILILQDLLHEVRLIRRHLDPPVSPEERSEFLEAVVEQMTDKPTPNGAKATVIEDELDPNYLQVANRLGIDPITRKPTKPKKAAKKLLKDIQEKGKPSDEK